MRWSSSLRAPSRSCVCVCSRLLHALLLCFLHPWCVTLCGAKPRWTCMQFFYFFFIFLLLRRLFPLRSSRYELRKVTNCDGARFLFFFFSFHFIVKGHLRPFSFSLTHSLTLAGRLSVKLESLACCPKLISFRRKIRAVKSRFPTHPRLARQRSERRRWSARLGRWVFDFDFYFLHFRENKSRRFGYLVFNIYYCLCVNLYMFAVQKTTRAGDTKNIFSTKPVYTFFSQSLYFVFFFRFKSSSVELIEALNIFFSFSSLICCCQSS